MSDHPAASDLPFAVDGSLVPFADVEPGWRTDDTEGVPVGLPRLVPEDPAPSHATQGDPGPEGADEEGSGVLALGSETMEIDRRLLAAGHEDDDDEEDEEDEEDEDEEDGEVHEPDEGHRDVRRTDTDPAAATVPPDPPAASEVARLQAALDAARRSRWSWFAAGFALGAAAAWAARLAG